MKDVSCYNCVHHKLCKYEPAWISFPMKDDEAAEKWFKVVPSMIANICSYYKEKQYDK